MVGRAEESAALEAAYGADESEFVAVYDSPQVAYWAIGGESKTFAAYCITS